MGNLSAETVYDSLWGSANKYLLFARMKTTSNINLSNFRQLGRNSILAGILSQEICMLLIRPRYQQMIWFKQINSPRSDCFCRSRMILDYFICICFSWLSTYSKFKALYTILQGWEPIQCLQDILSNIVSLNSRKNSVHLYLRIKCL